MWCMVGGSWVLSVAKRSLKLSYFNICPYIFLDWPSCLLVSRIRPSSLTQPEPPLTIPSLAPIPSFSSFRSLENVVCLERNREKKKKKEKQVESRFSSSRRWSRLPRESTLLRPLRDSMSTIGFLSVITIGSPIIFSSRFHLLPGLVIIYRLIFNSQLFYFAMDLEFVFSFSSFFFHNWFFQVINWILGKITVFLVCEQFCIGTFSLSYGDLEYRNC